MQMEAGAPFKMGYALTVIYRRAPDYAVNIISFLEKELRQVGAVLTCHAGNQSHIFHIQSVWDG